MMNQQDMRTAIEAEQDLHARRKANLVKEREIIREKLQAASNELAAAQDKFDTYQEMYDRLKAQAAAAGENEKLAAQRAAALRNGGE